MVNLPVYGGEETVMWRPGASSNRKLTPPRSSYGDGTVDNTNHIVCMIANLYCIRYYGIGNNYVAIAQ